MHDGIQIALHTATIKTTPIECDRFNSIIGGLRINRICQLDLPTGSRRLIAQDIKDVRCKHIAPMLAKFEGALSASGFSTRPATDPGSPFGTTTPYLEISGR